MFVAVVHFEATACSINYGRQSLLQKIQALLQGNFLLMHCNEKWIYIYVHFGRWKFRLSSHSLLI